MKTIQVLSSNYPTLWSIGKLIITSIIAIIVVWVVLKLEKKATEKWRLTRNNINLRYVESFIRLVVILVGVQFVIMSSDLTAPFGRVLFQGTTVIAAIAGFAAQPVIADLICGMMLSSTKPFDIGDRIELEDGTAGIVKDITMRHVTLVGIDTMIRVVPNSKLNAMKITNMSYGTKTRSMHLRFPVGYNTDVEKAIRVIRQAVIESPHTVPGKPYKGHMDYGPVYFLEYEEYSLIMGTTVYWEPSSPTEVVKSDVNTRVKRALEENGIEIPYKYVNVVLYEKAEGQGKAAVGSRQ